MILPRGGWASLRDTPKSEVRVHGKHVPFKREIRLATLANCRLLFRGKEKSFCCQKRKIKGGGGEGMDVMRQRHRQCYTLLKAELGVVLTPLGLRKIFFFPSGD